MKQVQPAIAEFFFHLYDKVIGRDKAITWRKPLLRGKARNLCASQYRQILGCARYLNTSGVLPVPPIPYTIQADLRDRDGQTPLLQAAANGHEGVVKALLATGKVEVDSKVGTAGTPLSWAAADGHAGVVKLLREYVPLNTYS